MVYYADDTILISTDTKAINKLLKLIQTISRKYGLNLNMDKCVAVKRNTEGKFSFPNGNTLQTEEQATYLGNELNNKEDITLEINNKLNEVRRTWFKLSTYWKAKDCNQKWQLIIYDAVIRSKLLYGLETVQLTETQEKKIDAFQMRGLRQIMKNTHTYYNREHTNKHILEEASKSAYPNKDRQINIFSQICEKRKIKLMGHNLRTANNDPLREVTFEDSTAERRKDYGIRRQERAKLNWIKDTKNEIWYTVLKERENFEETTEQNNKILAEARNRKF